MVKTRFAPSPTGDLHIGGVRTALYSWLYAKKHGGQFLVRIEDTDQERSTLEASRAICDHLAWLGLISDSPPIYQSDRAQNYRRVAETLVAQKKAYYCHCGMDRLKALREQQKQNKQKPRYDQKCRELNLKASPESVIRFKTPIEGEVSFEDQVYGWITVQNTELDDLIILRQDGMPTYNFSVVIDDIEDNITHVIRGEDHLSNTSRQMHIYRALVANAPVFAHCPMVLDMEGRKLSKRDGATDLGYYRELGLLPVGIFNYLLRLGWSHGDQELFSLSEMRSLFDIRGINKSAPKFDMDKLYHINQQHIRQTPPEDMLDSLAHQLEKLNVSVADRSALLEVICLYRDRSPTLKQMAEESVFLFHDILEYSEDMIEEHLKPNSKTLQALKQKFLALSVWDVQEIKKMLKAFAVEQQLAMAKVMMPLRAAMSGKTHTPDISQIIFFLGRDRCIQRLSLGVEAANSRLKY